MLNRYKFTFEADGNNKHQAFSSLLFRLKIHQFYEKEVTNLGFVHPDGVLRPFENVPEGYDLFELGNKSYCAIRKNLNYTQEKVSAHPNYLHYLPIDTLYWIPEKQTWEQYHDGPN